MKTINISVALITMALSFPVPGSASSHQFNFGALEESATRQDQISFGVGKSFNLQRREISIPKDYGRLITITTNEPFTILWFEANDGSIRNVNLDGTTPLIIKREGDLN